MERKKILILGSDFGTLDLVNEAHRKGLYVIVTDTMETSPTKQEADEMWNVSTTEIDLLERKCRESNISAITFGASDFNINNGRQLCKRLGLPVYCESDAAWEVACNKSLFKKICKDVGAPIAKDYYLTDALSPEELSQIEYPVVVKPVDKSGNRGMSYCHNEDELIAAYKYARSMSENATIIVERMLKGPEFAVSYVMADGEMRLLLFSSEHHQPGQKENLYSVICSTSAFLKQYREECNDYVKEVFKKAGCKDGLAWVECMRDIDGHFYLLEMGYRFGGEMTYVPYERVSGFNSVRWMLDISLGIKHTITDLPDELNQCYRGCAAAYYMFTTCEGVIGEMEGLKEIETMENVVLDFPKRVGNKVRYHAAMGIIRIYGRDCEELIDTILTINKILKIRDNNRRDMFIYFDDVDSIRGEYNQGLKEFGINI